MKLNDIIFSERPMIRLGRHILFWSNVFFLYYLVEASACLADEFQSTTVEFSVVDIKSDLNLRNFSTGIVNTAEGLVFLMAYCYIVVYFLMPRFLIKGVSKSSPVIHKYFLFGLLLIALTVTVEIIRLFYAGFSWQMPKDQIVFIFWMNGISFVNIGPPIFCGLFMTIKMLKTWYIEEEEKLSLVGENANAELQLLKAQINPHFLFNMLNNIYSFALSKSLQAPDLVLKLSVVLKYMINDCEASLVPVEKEIKMIEDYIGLEKVRYGNNLNLQVQIKLDGQNDKLITPFLLIPFIENSFKHGTSETLLHPWIKLVLIMTDDHLYFELSNSKSTATTASDNKKGIGLSNVERRLQLLYPKNHELAIVGQENSFTVILKAPLHHATHPSFNFEPIAFDKALPTLI